MNDHNGSAQRHLLSCRDADGETGPRRRWTVEYELPAGWAITDASEDRVLLFPDDPDLLTRAGFVPNVILELEHGAGSSGDTADHSPVLLASGGEGGDKGSTTTRAIAMDATSDGRTVFQLTGRRARGQIVARAVCTALDVQWPEVASAFDQVVDGFEVGAPVEGENDEG